MHTAEEEQRAVEPFIQYDLSCTAVISGLGHLSRGGLCAWCREHERTGVIGRRGMGRHTEV